jgi:hypothetical protein
MKLSIDTETELRTSLYFKLYNNIVASLCEKCERKARHQLNPPLDPILSTQMAQYLKTQSK